MARIRTIKPEFFTSEDITSLTPLSRLFYVSLWCESDREGLLEWKPGTFKLRYFPADQCDISSMGAELVNGGLIVLYESDGKTFAEIPTFKEHQIINNREAESIIPARVKVASPRVQAEGKEGREGKERKERKEIPSPDGVPESTWLDFKKLRAAKKAPITQTAIDGIQREACKAGMSTADALAMCCERGWVGFKSEWAAGIGAHSETFKERDARQAREKWERMAGEQHPDGQQEPARSILDVVDTEIKILRIAK